MKITTDKFKFQFQYGTIKRMLHSQKKEVYIRFNSNMVRLKGLLLPVTLPPIIVSIPIWYD